MTAKGRDPGEVGVAQTPAGGRAAAPPGDADAAALFDLPALKSLMDRFQAFSGLATAIVDLEGRILVASGWQEICACFHRVHPDAQRHCVESDVYLSANLNHGEYGLYRCKNGLWDMATPVVVDGQHVANVFCGQFLLEGEPTDPREIDQQALRYGFERGAYAAAFAKVPRVSRERARGVMELYVALAQVLVQLGRGTERKRMEAALRRSERSLNDAQRIAHLGNWELDLRTGVLSWSDEIYRIFELDPARFGASYDAFLDAIHPEDRDRVNRAYSDSVAQRTPYGIVHRLLMKDGRVKYVSEQCETTYDEDGTPLRSVGTVQDVTEHTLAELALERERDRVNGIMEASPVAMVRVTKEGRVDFANAAAQALLGLRRDDLGKRTYDAPEWGITDWDGGPFPPDQLPFVQVMRTGRPASANHAIVWPDGRRVLLSIRGAPLFDAGGQLEAAVFGIEDVTDRRRMEDQLRQSQKLEAVGRLAGGVAHDFNNLLTAILSGSDRLLETLREPDPLRDEANDIHQAAFRAAALTRQLLIFSRKQVVQPRVVDPWDVVTGLERMLRRLIGEDIQLETTGAPGAFVKVDPGQMEQVIVNLVVNARDAMPAGGHLRIETAPVLLEPETLGRHVAVVPGPYVLLAVSDTGCGMTPEVQSHLFEPFFTTKEAGKGTGLGLSTVYGIVTQAGGQVWAYSELGKGSVFKVYLPRVDAEAPAPAVPEAASSTARAPAQETVLVVEDEALVRKLAVRGLRAAGYAVLEAADGIEALEVAAGAGPIAVLVTDTVMPRMGGEELAHRLRALRPELRVLFMSGYTEQSAALQQELSERSAFLQKPFSVALLASHVGALIDRRG